MEEKTIRSAAAGNRDAFERLVTEYQTPVYRLCFRMVGNSEDAADLTQETFLKVWRALPEFRFRAAFSTWLYRLASNVCLDHLRSCKRTAAVSLVAFDGEDDEVTFDPPDPAPLPEERLLLSEEQRQLRAAFSSLDADDRLLLTLRVVNELSYADIAAILDIKEGTVKSRLSRARDRLRKKLLKIRNEAPASSSD